MSSDPPHFGSVKRRTSNVERRLIQNLVTLALIPRFSITPMDQAQEDLFQSILLDHDARPRGFFEMNAPTHVKAGVNPICGDRFVIFLEVDGVRIRRASFQGRGCTLSKASASMMVSMLSGKTTHEANAIRLALRERLTSSDPRREDSLGELEALSGVREHPSRVACVMLAWDALAAALE